MRTKMRRPTFTYSDIHGYVIIAHSFPGNQDMKTGDILLSVNGKTRYDEISKELNESDLREFEIVRPGNVGIIRFQSKRDPNPLAFVPPQGISDEQFTRGIIEATIRFALQTDEIAHPNPSTEIAAPTTKARWWRGAFDRIRSTIHSLVASNRTTKAVHP